MCILSCNSKSAIFPGSVRSAPLPDAYEKTVRLMRNVIVLILVLVAGAAPAALAQSVCSYPGDANHDGRVDVLDLLALGLNYGRSGPARPAPGNDWQPYCTSPWLQSLPLTGINTAFADSNGDGQVEAADQAAIALHYDNEVAQQGAPPETPYAPLFLADLPCVRISAVFRPDELSPHKFYADLNFEPDLNNFDGALGVALWLSYDPGMLLTDSVAVLLDDDNVDLLGIGVALEPGQLALAVAGRAANALSGPRRLASVAFVANGDLAPRADTTAFSLAFDSIMVVNQLGFRLCAQGVSGNIGLVTNSDLPIPDDEGIRLFPNPASSGGYLQLSWPEPLGLRAITLYDATGRCVATWSPATTLLMPEGLPAGMYFLRLEGDRGWKVVKVAF